MAASNNSTVSEEALSPASLVSITQDAAYKIRELIEEEGNLGLKLRVFITGGGCSGFQYGFTFDEVVNVDDMVITETLGKNDPASADSVQQNGKAYTSCTMVQLLIDPLSRMYLIGAEIDYKADLSGERFIIRNPNAKTTCGCGSSFSA